VQRDKEPLLDLAIKAMTQIFQPKSPFVSARVMDILFDGLGIDCTSDEFEAKSFCGAMENEKAIKVVNDTYLKFSVLGAVSCLFITKSRRRPQFLEIKLKIHCRLGECNQCGTLRSLSWR
jgi:hypothetical protein